MIRLQTMVFLALFSTPLAAVELALPVECPDSGCLIQNYVDHDPTGGHMDYACGAVAYDGHEGTDFRVATRSEAAQARVLAAASGVVRAVRNDVPDLGLRDDNAPDIANRECGNGVVIDHAEGWSTQYCHLARGSVTVRPGLRVAAGTEIGRIGMSGKTEFPHVHFAVRRNGRIVDPFRPDWTPGACNAGVERGLWNATAQQRLGYRDAILLAEGFAGAVPTARSIEAGTTPGFTDGRSDVLAAFVSIMSLRAGDSAELRLEAPSGRRLATTRMAELERPRALHNLIAGIRRPRDGYESGEHVAILVVMRRGNILFEKRFSKHVQNVMQR